MNYKCPVCGNELTEYEKLFKCGNNHCYDKSSSGYVNLLMSNASSLKRHGDDKLMVRARRDFLDEGYYGKLRENLVSVIESTVSEGSVICDVGCGEGYYTEKIASCKKTYDVFGVDISKDALKYACKRCKDVHFSVSSAFAIPFSDGSTDALVNVFAPCPYGEFYRVLKNNGILIKVVPLAEHLWELKKAVYEKPYKNKPEITDETLFERIYQKEIKYKINIESNEQIQNLFTMTPYYYKTSKDDFNKLSCIERLEVTAHFCIEIYKKR